MTADKKEILRYLGVKGEADENTAKMIDECMTALDEIIKPAYVYGVYETVTEDGYIGIRGTQLKLYGNNIRTYLSGCSRCALMAATLGIGVDNAVRQAQNSGDMLRSVVLNACAVEYIEKFCDNVQDKIKKAAASDGYGIKYRFSPGYGDLPIDIQGLFLRVLNAERKTGITLTSGNLMVPSKSVTAVIGFTNCAQNNGGGCDICLSQNDCEYRKEG